MIVFILMPGLLGLGEEPEAWVPPVLAQMDRHNPGQNSVTYGMSQMR
jgi:hypothetical protein